MTNRSRFRRYTHAMTDLVSGPGIDEPQLHAQGAHLLGDLLAHDDGLPEEVTRSSSEGYRQYLLHCDPLERFSVVSFVWEPGQKTPVHDHLTWGLVGQLRGEERCDEYVRGTAGGYRRQGSHAMRAGEIDRVSPSVGDVHAVSNASDSVSVSIHVYGLNIGACQRHVFDPATGEARTFVSGYSNAWLPNFWQP
jgi:predicted metal-dependent enzyme (double-stranded beta helix superfamily)